MSDKLKEILEGKGDWACHCRDLGREYTCSVHWLENEVIRLRAEVERLTAPTPVMTGGIVDWKAAYEFECKRAKEAERDRDEALAQVAVLVTPIQGLCALLTSNNLGKESVKEATTIIRNLPAEARDFLDRLQRAEAVVRAAEELLSIHPNLGNAGSQYLKRLAMAIAAYQEQT